MRVHSTVSVAEGSARPYAASASSVGLKSALLLKYSVAALLMNACAAAVSGVSVRAVSDAVYVLFPPAFSDTSTVSVLPPCSSVARVTLSVLSTGQFSVCCRPHSVRVKAAAKLSDTVYTGSSPSSLI